MAEQDVSNSVRKIAAVGFEVVRRIYALRCIFSPHRLGDNSFEGSSWQTQPIGSIRRFFRNALLNIRERPIRVSGHPVAIAHRIAVEVPNNPHGQRH